MDTDTNTVIDEGPELLTPDEIEILQHMNNHNDYREIRDDINYIYKIFHNYYEFMRELAFNKFLQQYGNYELFVAADHENKIIQMRRGTIITEKMLRNQEVFEGIVDRIYYLHRMGIIHGDIKLSNFVLYDGRVEVIDFGASTFTRISKYIQQPIYATIFRPRDKFMSEKSEVYALGMMLSHFYYKRFSIRVPDVIRQMTRSSRNDRCDIKTAVHGLIRQGNIREYSCSYYNRKGEDELKEEERDRLVEFHERILKKTENTDLLKYTEAVLHIVVDWKSYTGSTKDFNYNEYMELVNLLEPEDLFPFEMYS